MFSIIAPLPEPDPQRIQCLVDRIATVKDGALRRPHIAELLDVLTPWAPYFSGSPSSAQSRLRRLRLLGHAGWQFTSAEVNERLEEALGLLPPDQLRRA